MADRISALPDAIISHILSFLPTKQSAATSILSKRWNPLWLSVLALDFDDQHFTNFNTFKRFVSSVICKRRYTNTALPIQSFCLKCSNSDGLHLVDIIRDVKECGLQNLNLDITYHMDSLTLSFIFLTSCVNLTVLKLKRVSLRVIDYCDINLPLLKTLHLDTVTISGPGSLKRFLCMCPNLEDLQLNDLRLPCYVFGEFNCLLKLVRANIFKQPVQNIPLDFVRNAKFLCVKLHYPYKYQVPAFINLTYMEIIFELSFDWPEKWTWLVEALQHCPKLQSLVISFEYIKMVIFHEKYNYLFQIRDINWLAPPIIPECLSSQLRTCLLKNYYGMNCELQFAEYIMQNSKVLKTIRIESSNSVDINVKHQMLRRLSISPRASATCKLLFD